MVLIGLPWRHDHIIRIREGFQKKNVPFSSLLLLRGPAPPPPLVVPWAIKILGPYFNVAVDALGPETDFTLEKKKQKKWKKNYWKHVNIAIL